MSHRDPSSLDYNHSFNITGSDNRTNYSLNHNTECFNSQVGDQRCSNTIDSYNTTYTNFSVTVTDDRSEILPWLSPLEPHMRHYDVRRCRIAAVGDWLLGTEKFRSWHSDDGQSESQEATIFCSGDPGVGKTYIW